MLRASAAAGASAAGDGASVRVVSASVLLGDTNLLPPPMAADGTAEGAADAAASSAATWDGATTCGIPARECRTVF